jgi:hypothetical protein
VQLLVCFIVLCGLCSVCVCVCVCVCCVYLVRAAAAPLAAAVEGATLAAGPCCVLGGTWFWCGL